MEFRELCHLLRNKFANIDKFGFIFGQGGRNYNILWFFQAKKSFNQVSLAMEREFRTF